MSEQPATLLSVERQDHLLILRMQRSAKRNAIDRALADAIDAALNTLEDDPTLWAGVLTGDGSIFSAGSDLRANGDYVTIRPAKKKTA